MPDLMSRPYHPKMCCERCVFGTGEHAEWCDEWQVSKRPDAIDAILREAENEEVIYAPI